MRIVAVADTHMFHADFGALPAGDVLVHAGDMGRGGDDVELAEVARWLRAQPHAHKLVIPGNHDWMFQLDEVAAREMFAGLTVLIDEEAVIGGLRFWGSPWTPEFHSWAFMLPPGAALAAKWAKIPHGIDVLVTHGPPREILDDVGAYRGSAEPAGCAALRTRAFEVRPRLHLFGHIHSQRGEHVEDGVRFVNCTTNEAELPATVVDV